MTCVWRASSTVLLGIALLVLTAASAIAAPAASWSLKPSFYDFGGMLPGTGPSSPAVFTLTNTGEVELPVPGVVLTSGSSEGPEPLPFGFGFTASDCESRASLGLAESCKVEVTFNPLYPGPRQGSITFADPSSQVAPASATFSGRGIGPIVSFSPLGPLTAVVGEGPSLVKVLTVTNEGDADLAISGISFVGDNAGHFAIAGGRCQPGGDVASGASCTIQVTYSPASAGIVAGDLRLTDNAAHGFQVTRLQGLGVTLSPSRPVPLATFISQRPPKVTPRRFVTFRFGMEAEESVRFVCKLDRNPAGPCSSPKVYRHLMLGPHVFRVRARTRAPDVSRVFSIARFRIVARRRSRRSREPSPQRGRADVRHLRRARLPGRSLRRAGGRCAGRECGRAGSAAGPSWGRRRT